jgi:hypothetical protein
MPGIVEISVNMSYPKFVGLAPREVRVDVSAVGFSPPFLNFIQDVELTFQTIGRPGTNHKQFAVRGDYPIRFVAEDFALLGNNAASPDTYQASRVIASLVDMVRRGVLVVKHSGTTLTPEQVLVFTP